MTRADPAPRLHEKRRGRLTLKGALFAAPFLIGFVVFYAYPIIASAWYSLTDFNLFQTPRFIGLDNYQHMASDALFWKAAANTAILTVFGVPLTLIISLVGAHLLNLPVKGQPLYRALVYVPVIVPVVVGTYLWRWLLNTEYGFIDWALGAAGLPQPAWLTEPEWAKPAVLLVALWTIGGTILIYLAALKDVPNELYEAASIDGAGAVRRFASVTWPMLSPVTLFQIIVTMIAYLQIFTQPYLLTQGAVGGGSTGNGGVENSMLTYAMYLFSNAFSFLKMGYASAMAWVLFLVTLVLTGLILLSARKWVHSGTD